MSEARVLVVITSYCRPANTQKVIQAVRAQSHPPTTVVVVDNSPKYTNEPELYPKDTMKGADDVWRFTQNLGCPCHFAPALCLFEHDYVLFLDDDLLPGEQALANLLHWANHLGGKFATLGQTGRIFQMDKPWDQRYKYGNTTRGPHSPRTCHITCRAHLVGMNLMGAIPAYRSLLIEKLGIERMRPLVSVHDDMLMCFALQQMANVPSYVIPASGNPELELVHKNLDETGAICKRPQHIQERNEFIRAAMECGWRPLI